MGHGNTRNYTEEMQDRHNPMQESARFYQAREISVFSVCFRGRIRFF